MTETHPAEPSPNLSDASVGALVKQMSAQLSRLVRDEMKLAEAELADKGKRAAKGAGLFGGSGVVALYGVGCLLAAAIAGLSVVLPVWLSALLVGVALLAVAGLAAMIGRNQLKKATPAVPQQTVDSVKADVEEIKERVHR